MFPAKKNPVEEIRMEEIRKTIRKSLAGELNLSPKKEKELDLDAFATETAIYVSTFQHVFNPRLPESKAFKSYIENMTSEQLANIGYTSDGRQIPKLRSGPRTLRDFVSAYKKAKSTNATDADKIDYFIQRFSRYLFKRKNGKAQKVAYVQSEKGRPALHFDRLQLRCFEYLASTYTKYTGLEPYAGSESNFLQYTGLCVKGVSGNLKSIRALSEVYLNHISLMKKRLLRLK